MSDYYQQMARDKAEIQELKRAVNYVAGRTQAIGNMIPDKSEIEQATRPARRTPQENRALFEKWGFDAKNPQHRQAWRDRHKTSF